jgi:cobalt-zinc-cadmium efflux system protein
MEHSHKYDKSANSTRAFKIGILLNMLFIAVEVLSGIFSHSMALLADAGHNLSDVMILAFSWVAISLSQRKPTLKFTYGFRRSTILVALLNTLLLLLAVVFIVSESMGRISHPEGIKSSLVIFTALTGIVINGVTACLFSGKQANDLNIRSAFIHFVADALVSFGVVVAGIIMLVTGIQWVDAAVSLLIAAVILWSSYKLLINSVNLALDAVPENIDINGVREFLLALPEVDDIHDLHIWALSTTESALTVHLETKTDTDVNFIDNIQKQLNNRFGIGHSTIQIEYGESSSGCNNCN